MISRLSVYASELLASRIIASSVVSSLARRTHERLFRGGYPEANATYYGNREVIVLARRGNMSEML